MDDSAEEIKTTSDKRKEILLRSYIGRRDFLFRAALIGVAATSAPAILAACQTLADAPTTNGSTRVPQATSTPTRSPRKQPGAKLKPQAGPTSHPASVTTTTATASGMVTPKNSMSTATPIATPTEFTSQKPMAGPPAPAPSTPAVTTSAPVISSNSPILKTERARISHLVRRAGFGANEEQLARFHKMGLSATIDYFIDFHKIDNSALETHLDGQDLDYTKQKELQRWWLQRMAYTERPLEEKMTLFWHGLLTSSFRKAGRNLSMYNQNSLFRDMGMGPYDQLLKAVSRDPAMLVYLDSRTNKKKAPNENYSRELMELFSLGIGHFTETDVRESARAFTGWQVKKKTRFIFNKKQHDFGLKTFLGQTGNWDGNDVVDIILAQPAAGEYIARRLWEFFAYPDPEPETVAHFAYVFRSNIMHVRPLVRAIFESEEFYSSRAHGALIKSPAELAASAVRSMNIETNFQPLTRGIASMGQELFSPPNVAGWSGGATWINSSTLLERINLANRLTTGKNKNVRFKPNEVVRIDPNASDRMLVDTLVNLLLGDDTSSEFRDLLEEHLRQTRVPVNQRIRTLSYLILASPNYQMS